MESKKTVKQKVIIAISIILILVLILAGGGLAVDKYLGLNHKEIDEDNLGVNSEIKDKYVGMEIVNIALFGLDTRDSDSFEGNSDAIKIISINKKTNDVKITTILRDSEVSIDGYGKEKITHAYGYGGPELAIKTLNQNFGLDITEYITVNFLKLGELIDAVGGVDVEITEAERVETNNIANSEGIEVPHIQKSGMVHLTGQQASAYVRIRGIDSDNARVDRQIKVMDSIYNNALKISPSKYPKFAKELLKLVETSMDYNDIMSFSPMLNKKLNTSQMIVPDANYYKVRGGEYGKYIGNTKKRYWVWQYDLTEATNTVHNFIYGETIDK